MYWPTLGGRTRGLAWYGSPKILRWWWALTRGKKLQNQIGCGCIKPLKDAWNAVVAAALLRMLWVEIVTSP